jgi:hypothetical protein
MSLGSSLLLASRRESFFCNQAGHVLHFPITPQCHSRVPHTYDAAEIVLQFLVSLIGGWFYRCRSRSRIIFLGAISSVTYAYRISSHIAIVVTQGKRQVCIVILQTPEARKSPAEHSASTPPRSMQDKLMSVGTSNRLTVPIRLVSTFQLRSSVSYPRS